MEPFTTHELAILYDALYDNINCIYELADCDSPKILIMLRNRIDLLNKLTIMTVIKT